MNIETRWYRDKMPMDIKCVDCEDMFTPHREFAIFHADCYEKILDAEAGNAPVLETMDQVSEKKNIRTYVQESEIPVACCSCNRMIEANQEFVIIHYSCNLKHIELMEKAQKLEGKNIEEKPDDKDGRE